MKVAIITRIIDKGAGNLTPILSAFPSKVEWKVFSSPSDIGACTILLRHRRELQTYDLLHINSLICGAFNSLHLPTVCSVHTVQKTEYQLDTTFRNRVGMRFETHTVNKVDRFLTVDPSITRDFLTNYPKVDASHVEFVRHATLDPDVHFSTEKDPKLILASGRLVKRKNFELFIDLAKQLPQYNFVLVGEGNHYNELASRSRNVTNMTMLPYLPRKDYCDLLSQAFVYIMTSYYEGYPTTVFEAMQAGTPVLSTKIPSMAEMVIHGQRGYYFTSPSECVKLVNMLAKYSHLYESCQTLARDYVLSQPSATTIANQFITVYEELL